MYCESRRPWVRASSKYSSLNCFTRRAFGTLYSNDPRTKVPEALGLMGSGRFFGYVKMSKIAANIGKMF